jgi:hypothetical protein
MIMISRRIAYASCPLKRPVIIVFCDKSIISAANKGITADVYVA